MLGRERGWGGLASRPLEVRAPLCVLPTCAMSTPVQGLGESRRATGFLQAGEFPSAFPGGGSPVGTGDAEAGDAQPPRPSDTSQKAVQAWGCIVPVPARQMSDRHSRGCGPKGGTPCPHPQPTLVNGATTRPVPRPETSAGLHHSASLVEAPTLLLFTPLLRAPTHPHPRWAPQQALKGRPSPNLNCG